MQKLFRSLLDNDALQKLKYQPIIHKTVSEIDASDIVVEVACGTGLISFEVAQKAKNVYATDISSEMIERCLSKQQEFNVDNVAFSQEDSYSLSCKDNFADSLVCCNALHVMNDPVKALHEMKRVLKRNGKLIIPTYCHNEGKSLSARTIRTAIRFANLIGVLPSISIWKKEDLLETIQSVGFLIEAHERIADANMFCYYVSAIKP